MKWHNDRNGWGLISIGLHWLSALVVFGLFGLGLWMTGLDYYHPWYKQGPDLHRGIGVLLLMAFVLRLTWRCWQAKPEPMAHHEPWERLAARAAHALLYLLPFLLLLSGWLISTADGRALAVFDWFELPPLVLGIERQEEIAGDIHRWLAWGLIGVAAVHAMGALKHHFIDHDKTLMRMLRTGN